MRALIDGSPGYAVVGEAPSGTEAVELVDRLHPQVVLMGMARTGMDAGGALEATRQITGRPTPPAVVIASMDHDVGALMAALRAGARGYVVYDVDQAELIAVIEHTLAGEHAIESALATALLLQLANQGPAEAPPAPAPLTAREMEILRLITLGQTNREIAGRLAVAVGTVKIHVEHILAKLGVAGRTEAAVQAIQSGMVRPGLERNHPSTRENPGT
jgi:DNA-binding NarL/FixJ family response regulator